MLFIIIKTKIAASAAAAALKIVIADGDSPAQPL